MGSRGWKGGEALEVCKEGTQAESCATGVPTLHLGLHLGSISAASRTQAESCATGVPMLRMRLIA